MVTMFNEFHKTGKVTQSVNEFVMSRLEMMEDLEADYNEFYKGLRQLTHRAQSLPADTREYRAAQQLRNHWHRVTTVKARGF